MSFTSRRGRPAAVRPCVDLGTPELIMKRLHNVTVEMIDLCLQKGIIDEAQHWCAIHLRWLHTLRFGISTPKAVDTSNIGRCEYTSGDTTEWWSERESEYTGALDILRKTQSERLVIDIAVHNISPSFFHAPRSLTTAVDVRIRLKQAEADIATLHDGLEGLCRLWGKKKVY